VKIRKYIKAAFASRWNLLGLAAGMGLIMITGQYQLGLPLLAAAEVAWLGFAGTHPSFRRYVAIQENQRNRADDAEAAKTRMRMMLGALPRGAQRRYEALKKQCDEMRMLTRHYQAAQGTEADQTLADMRLGGLDRLMWLFLKLLYTEHSLNRFFETTSLESIENEIRQIEARLKAESERPADQQRDRMIATMQDSLKTCQLRRQNFERARESYELVKAEQRRLENKIRSVAETGFSKGDPSILSSQVDDVTESLHDTEKALNDLEFVTGFSTYEEEAVPEIVTRRTIRH
jgi:hypothetical protein